LLLERGIAVRQGARFLRAALPDILGRARDAVEEVFVRVWVETTERDMGRFLARGF